MTEQQHAGTIGGIIDENKGLGPGFNTLRLVLSVAVMCWHSLPLCYGFDFEQRIWISPLGRPFMLIMPVFFGLSGFLVMGSALRIASMTPFLASRGLRIFPALATEITMSALLIGGIFTSLPLSQFFTHPDFFRYFGSLYGKVVFSLPGVNFPHNPYDGLINNNLWTIPPELLCYVYMALVILCGYFRNKWTITIAAAAITLLNLGYDLSVGFEQMEGRWPARYLVMAFAYGNAAFLWRYSFPYNRALCLAMLLVGCVGLRTPLAIYVSLLALTYVMMYLGATPLPMPAFLAKGDYSYGIYLYGFPVQQLVIHLLPGTKEFYWNILIAVPIATLIAMVSWHLVEKPALSLRPKLQKWLGPHASPARPIAVFIALLCLLGYGAFLLRFSFIAFSEPLSVAVALKYTAIVTGAAVVCMIARALAQSSIRPAQAAA